MTNEEDSDLERGHINARLAQLWTEVGVLKTQLVELTQTAQAEDWDGPTYVAAREGPQSRLNTIDLEIEQLMNRLEQIR